MHKEYASYLVRPPYKELLAWYGVDVASTGFQCDSCQNLVCRNLRVVQQLVSHC